MEFINRAAVHIIRLCLINSRLVLVPNELFYFTAVNETTSGFCDKENCTEVDYSASAGHEVAGMSLHDNGI